MIKDVYNSKFNDTNWKEGGKESTLFYKLKRHFFSSFEWYSQYMKHLYLLDFD